MIFSCSKCGQKYNIDPAQIPAGRVSAKCKKCGGPVPLRQDQDEDDKAAAKKKSSKAAAKKAALSKKKSQAKQGQKSCGAYIGLALLLGIIGLAGGYYGAQFLAPFDPLATPTAASTPAKCPECPKCPKCDAPTPAPAPEPSAFDKARLGMSAEDIFNLGKMLLLNEASADNGINMLKMSADASHAPAQYSLYAMYSKKKGVPGSSEITARDEDKAFKWLKTAAENGLPLAQISLSTAYSEGKFGEKDEEQAKTWLQKAVAGYTTGAEDGDVEAQFMLGLLLTGAGANKGLLSEVLPADKGAAVEWLGKAKKQGVDSATAYQNFLKERYGPVF